MTALPIPLVCAPERLAGAEARAAAFPHLGYDWAIRYADRPIVPVTPRQYRHGSLRQARSELYLEAKHHGGHTR